MQKKTFCVVNVLIILFACGETSASSYATLDAARSAGTIQRGWVPDVAFSAGVLPIPGSRQARQSEIAFTFAWPVGTKSSVETTIVKRKDVEGQPTLNTESNIRYTMAVEKGEPGGIIIDYVLQGRGPTVTVNGKPMPPQESLLESFQTMVPTMHVDKEGRFSGIADVGRIRDSILKFLDAAAPDARLSEKSRTFLESLLSPQTLAQLAENEWNALVGFLIGQRLAPGELYESAGVVPLPLPGAPAVDMVTRFEVEGPLQCKEGGGLRLCARLTMTSRPDEAQVQQAIEDFTRQALAAADSDTRIGFRKLDVSIVTTLVTEIDTLRPHEFSTEKKVSTTITGPAGREQKSSHVVRRHTTYAY